MGSQMDRLLIESLPAKVNGSERLVWRGRHVSVTFLIQADTHVYAVQIYQGRIRCVTRVDAKFDEWAFALRASQASWDLFFSSLPPPGFHDLMAMLKLKHLKMDGNLYPLMSHLLYFKDVLASVRASHPVSEVTP